MYKYKTYIYSSAKDDLDQKFKKYTDFIARFKLFKQYEQQINNGIMPKIIEKYIQDQYYNKQAIVDAVKKNRLTKNSTQCELLFPHQRKFLEIELKQKLNTESNKINAIKRLEEFINYSQIKLIFAYHVIERQVSEANYIKYNIVKDKDISNDDFYNKPNIIKDEIRDKLDEFQKRIFDNLSQEDKNLIDTYINHNLYGIQILYKNEESFLEKAMQKYPKLFYKDPKTTKPTFIIPIYNNTTHTNSTHTNSPTANSPTASPTNINSTHTNPTNTSPPTANSTNTSPTNINTTTANTTTANSTTASPANNNYMEFRGTQANLEPNANEVAQGGSRRHNILRKHTLRKTRSIKKLQNHSKNT